MLEEKSPQYIKFTWGQNTGGSHDVTHLWNAMVVTLKDIISNVNEACIVEEMAREMLEHIDNTEPFQKVQATPQAHKGWQCPKCGAILAPWVFMCRCHAPKYEYVPNTVWGGGMR